MIPIVHSLNVLLPLVYGFSVLTYATSFRTKEPATGVLASRALLAGLVLHATYLVIRGFAFRHFPITNFFESFSMIAFGLGLIYYVVERKVGHNHTGVFFTTIVFSFQLISSMFLRDVGGLHPLLSNPLFGIHATLTLLGISALATSCLYGMLYLMLAKEMKRQRFGVIYDRLPPLDTLEEMAIASITIGLYVLGGGLLLGHFWATKTLGTFMPLDAKVIITDATWVFYVVGLYFVRRRGWSGLRMGHFTFWTFLAYFSSMLVVNMFASSFHKFYV